MTQHTSATRPQVDEATGQQMQAIAQDTYGSADVLELRTIDRPEPGADEVLIEVHAAGVDRGVWHLMTGLPYLVRLAGYGVAKPKQPVLGLDVSGRVVAIGDERHPLRTGRRGVRHRLGLVCRVRHCAPGQARHKPANITFEQAAVSAVSGITALEALTDVGDLQAGQKVLIIGASGGVGTYAVQLAKALGAVVTGVSGPAMIDTVRALGADHVIDYTTEDFVDSETRYDLILDIGGRNNIRRLRHVLAPKGTLVIVGGEDGNRITGGVGRQARAMMLSPFIGQRLTTFISSETFTNIERLAAHMESGAVVPSIGNRYELADVPAAIRDLEAGHSKGKSVIVVRPES